MAIVPVLGNAIISDVLDPVMGSMKDVIEMEDHRHILQTDLRRMERLLQYTDIFFRYQQKDPPEMVKIWLQLLLNSLTDAKGLFDRSGQRQSCHDCVVCHPGRLSKEITEWKALFNHIYEAFSTDLFPHIVLSGNAIISRFVDSVMELLKDVIQMEDHRRTLQTDLRPMESLLRDITTLFRDEVDIFTFFQNQEKVPLEIVMTRLQSLRNSLREAECLLSIDRSATRRSCLDCLVRKPQPRRLSKEIRDWNAFPGGLYDGLQSDLSILMTSLHFLQSRPLHIEEPLLEDVDSGIRDAQAQLESWLHGGDPVHLIGVYGMPGVGKTSLLKKLCDQVSNVFDRVIWVTVSEYDKMFDLQCRIADGKRLSSKCSTTNTDTMSSEYDKMFDLQRRIADGIGMSLPSGFDGRKMKLSAYLKQKKFLLVLDDLWSRLDLQELGVAFGAHQHSKVVFSTRRKDLIREMGAEESIEIQPLSRDEAWMLFRRVAFKDDLVSMEIEERTMRFADECRGVPLVINIVAEMIGQTTARHWDSCFSLMQESVDPSFPATNPRLDAQLYRLLRWSYDALPNSVVKNCFLYSAMSMQTDEGIDSRELVQMWIGEGLVKSEQGTYLMDMAIGRKYLKLLVDRCFFHIVTESTNAFRKSYTQVHDVIPSIRVHDVIREMAMYIAQREGNCLFMATQNLQNFPEVHNNNCKRISLANNFIEDLPTDLRCPNLVSLILEGNTELKELPSEFVLSLTSLRVLNLSRCMKITSVPTSLGQLRLLEFLSLSHLPIKDLPEEICNLSRLQFLNLSKCTHLESLPVKIRELKNLKCLNLDFCNSLRVIPHEMSELTSLTRLQLSRNAMEAPASIWSLKGLKNLTELEVWLEVGIKDGIMGTWTEMRHLRLGFDTSSLEIMQDFPEDMKSMKKLQSFKLTNYTGLSMPNCRFEHLEMVRLYGCKNIRELYPLEWMPNLKVLKLEKCSGLEELGIKSGERVPSGCQRLEKLVLKWLDKLESLGGASKMGVWDENLGGESNTEVWDERTLPRLRVLKIKDCKSLRRFPIGMEKLQKLSVLMGGRQWWEGIIWEEHDHVKIKLQNIFKEYRP